MGAGRTLGAPLNITTRDYNDVERMVIEREHKKEDYVIMHINPQRIAIRHRKVIQRVQTNTRWVFQHWGAEPINITYNGVTGYMNTKIAQEYMQRYIPGQLNDFRFQGDPKLSPYRTPAYEALLKLRTFYEEPHKSLQGMDLTKISGAEADDHLRKLRLNLYYRNIMYIGYFTRMEIQETETSPWMWSYSMEFIAFNTSSDSPLDLLKRVSRAELAKAAREAGIAVDTQMAQGVTQARGAPKITGTIPPENARSRAAAASTEGWRNPSRRLSRELEQNLIERNLVTEQSTDTE